MCDEVKVSECGQLPAMDDACVCKIRNFNKSYLSVRFFSDIFPVFFVYCFCNVYLYLCSLHEVVFLIRHPKKYWYAVL
jgi:hypothetical protein